MLLGRSGELLGKSEELLGTSGLLIRSTLREVLGKSPGNFWGSSGKICEAQEVSDTLKLSPKHYQTMWLLRLRLLLPMASCLCWMSMSSMDHGKRVAKEWREWFCKLFSTFLTALLRWHATGRSQKTSWVRDQHTINSR